MGSLSAYVCGILLHSVIQKEVYNFKNLFYKYY
jgi:hypothetical protein